MADDLHSGRPRNTPSLWSELESLDCESDALTTQPRFLLMLPYRNYNKSKSLNEKRSLYLEYLEYHMFCTHFCKSAQCTKKSTQAETKLPFPRRSYTKLMCIKTRRVPFQSSESFYGYHFAMCGLSSYQGNTESRKNVPKKERQKLLN